MVLYSNHLCRSQQLVFLPLHVSPMAHFSNHLYSSLLLTFQHLHVLHMAIFSQQHPHCNKKTSVNNLQLLCTFLHVIIVTAVPFMIVNWRQTIIFRIISVCTYIVLPAYTSLYSPPALPDPGGKSELTPCQPMCGGHAQEFFKFLM